MRPVAEQRGSQPRGTAAPPGAPTRSGRPRPGHRARHRRRRRSPSGRLPDRRSRPTCRPRTAPAARRRRGHPPQGGRVRGIHLVPALDVDRQRHAPPRTGRRRTRIRRRLVGERAFGVHRRHHAIQEEGGPVIAAVRHLGPAEPTVEPAQCRDAFRAECHHREASRYTVHARRLRRRTDTTGPVRRTPRPARLSLRRRRSP